MRRTLYHGMMVALIGLSAVSSGCRGGWGWSSPSWLSWGSKPSAASSTAQASRPSTQLPPSPSATMTANGAAPGGNAAGSNPAGGAGYPTTPYARNYAAQQTSTAPGYYTGPYNTGAAGATGAPGATTPYGANAATGAYPTTGARTAAPAGGANPAYGTPSTYGSPAGGYGAPSSYGAPPTNSGAASGYGGAAGAGNYGTAAANYPSTSYPTAPNGAYGAAAAPAAPGNYATTPGYTPAATAGLTNREGGYRPGSTGRSVSADGALRNGPAVQPADYQSGAAAAEAVPEYTPAPAPPPGYGGNGGTFVPPSGS